MKRHLGVICVLSIILMLLIACAQPAPAPTSTPASSPTSSPKPTSTPTSTPTLTPTPTPTPTTVKIVARAAHSGTPEGYRTRWVDLIKRDMEAKFPGRITIEHYPSNQLLGSTKAVSAAREGTIQICAEAFSYWGTWDAAFYIDWLGFSFTYDGFKSFIAGDGGKVLANRLEKLGFKSLGLINLSMTAPFVAKKQITKLDDFKGLKVRAPGFAIARDNMGALGASAVSIDPGEVITALQTGTVDAAYTSLETVQEYKWDEYVKYAPPPLSPVGIVVAANLDWVNKLPADIQKYLIEEAVPKAQKDTQAYVDNLMSTAVSKAKSKGMVFSKVDPSELEKMKAALTSVWSKQEAGIGADLMNLIKTQQPPTAKFTWE